MSTEYRDALAKCTALLSLKLCATHLLTVRQRMMESNYKVSEDNAIGDSSFGKVLVGIFQGMLLAWGPKADSVQRMTNIAQNTIENEPMWFAVALMTYLRDPTASVDLLWAYVACRFVHSITYLFELQPFRLFAYVGGLTTTMFMAGNLLRL
eukprot:gene14347-22010_t